MENIILRRYVALATNWAKSWKNNHFFKAHIILTALSVAALSIFLIIVTALVYLLFIQQISLDHPMVSSLSEQYHNTPQEEQERLHETRETLLNTMVAVDAVMIVLSIIPIYILTRRILKPVEKAAQQQKRLIADVSHELRTPLAIMLSGVESALLHKDITPRCRDILKAQCEDITYLKNITNDLLLIEEVQVQKNYTPLNLYTVSKTSLEMITLYATEHTILCRLESTVKTEPIIRASKVQIQRLLLNLLKNAIDYSPRDTEVFISIESKKEDILLTVKDNGIGISKEDVQHITDRFYKADTARTSEGSGLGLSLVAQIAKAHNAELTIESTLGKGTSITVAFPTISS